MDKRPQTTTGELRNRLRRAKTIQTFIARNQHALEQSTLAEALDRICTQKRLVREHVIRRADIDVAFGHQIFRGLRHPSRDKVLQLCFGLALESGEAAKLLRAANKRGFHPRIKRDAAILFCLDKRLPLNEAQQMLFELELPTLGDERD